MVYLVGSFYGLRHFAKNNIDYAGISQFSSHQEGGGSLSIAGQQEVLVLTFGNMKLPVS